MEVAKVVEVMIAALSADTALTALTDGVPRIYKNRTRSVIQIPGVYWTVVSAVPKQNQFSVVIQWDVWGRSADEQFQMEARLIALMHSDTIIDFGGLNKMWASLQMRHDMLDDQQGTDHSALDFRYEPIREVRYSGA